jgi:type I restriction enzyme R subunit
MIQQIFNEDNTVEQMLIHVAKEHGWDYIKAKDIPRSNDSILVDSWLVDALVRLNRITYGQAERVVYDLRAIIFSGNTKDGLIQANDKFRKKLFEENSYPFGPNGDNVNIRFFSDNPAENYCVVTNQWEFPKASIQGGKRLDLVFLINGIPMVIGEAKTPVKSAVTWGDGAQDVINYQKSIPEMFVPNILCFATEGKELQYASIGADLEHWGPWFADEERRHGTLADVDHNFVFLMNPLRLLDIYRFFTVFTASPSGKKIKIVCRYQQYLGGEAIVQRVLSTFTHGHGPKKGLIWHFQGSGKSWLMVFAAQKLRLMKELEAPTIVIVDDRIDLEDQITGDFTRAEIPNVVNAPTKDDLEKFFEQDQRKILITTIFKFGDVEAGRVLNRRQNIIVMVDEAHRTQEKDLGMKMRQALPNAFFFGLTGTPINKRDHNTFAAFGDKQDEGGYMSKYTFQNSVDDGATLELKFKTVPVEMHLDKERLQEAFDEMTDQISEDEKNELTKRANVEAFFTADKRINEVSKYIVNHFRTYVEPTGMKAQVVVYNRACCVKYKRAIDALLGTTDQTTIVMHTGGDKADEYKEWKRDRSQENKLLDEFRDPFSPLKIVIVTSKLLTGFDAPILQCMYLDKPMKDHTLLQAICRTNRKYTVDKKCGLIVDFVGVFDDVARSLAFDDATVKNVIKNIDEIKELIPKLMKDCLDFFPGVDRTIGGWEGLTAAQQCLKDEKTKTEFAKHFNRLSKAWETVSPDECLLPYQSDYAWLAQVYQSVKPVSDSGALIWTLLGAKTIEIIHQNIDTIDIGQPLEDLVVDADVIDAVLKDEKNRDKKIIEIEKMLRLRLNEHKNEQNFKKFAEKLDELRQQMEENLISSIDFLKGLLETAKGVVEEEKRQNQPENKHAKAKAALTELFETVKTENTPIIVERVVNDIDENVTNIVRKFKDAFKSVEARKQIRQKLRAILWVKYSIKDNDVFEKAYSYIEQYY